MKRQAFVVSALAISLASTAQATSTVSAQLSNFQMTTTGTVTPRVQSYYSKDGSEMGTMLAYGRTETGQAFVTDTGALNWQTNQSQSSAAIIDETQGQTPASWAVNPSASSSAGSTQAHAQVNQDLSMIASVSTGSSGGYAHAMAIASMSFWLEANSSLTATWDTHLTGSNAGENYALSYLNSASSGAGADTFSGPAMAHYTLADGQPLSPMGDFSFEKGDTSRTLTIQTTDTGRIVHLRVEAFAATFDHVLSSRPPAVPEPETWAMALLGLTVLGVNARRRAN